MPGGTMLDPYRKLKPPSPTPEDEMCCCETVHGLVLLPHLSSNPLVCHTCYGEVAPERIALAPDLADAIGTWSQFQIAFETLWLDSSEYEEFALDIMEDMNSPLNQRGYALAQKLDPSLPCWYFVWQSPPSGTTSASRTCPRWEGELDRTGKHPECSACKIAVP